MEIDKQYHDEKLENIIWFTFLISVLGIFGSLTTANNFTTQDNDIMIKDN